MAAPAVSGKQSRRSVRSLSVQEKVFAIDRVHDGESKASVARDIGVPESTLRGWCKGEDKLRGIVARSASNTSENAVSSNEESFDKPSPDVTNNGTDWLSLDTIKREHSSDDAVFQTKKYPRLEKALEAPLADTPRKCDSPINFSKGKDDISSCKSRSTHSPSIDLSQNKTESRHPVSQSLPALAAIASAISNKNQMLYSAYSNGVLTDVFSKQDPNKPLDYSTKLSPRLPRPEVNEALVYWLQAQRDRTSLPMSPMEGRTADTSSWFWKWYKNHGVGLLPQAGKSVNGDRDHEQLSEEEDEPPATAADAVRHGEKFLRWLECCSDPSVTALQILQFRYLLNNVKECAERRARQSRTKTRSRRK